MTLHSRTPNVHFIHRNCSVIITHYKVGRWHVPTRSSAIIYNIPHLYEQSGRILTKFFEVPIWEYSCNLWVPSIVLGFFLPHFNKYTKRDTQNSREFASIGCLPYGALLSEHIPLRNAKGVSSYEICSVDREDLVSHTCVSARRINIRPATALERTKRVAKAGGEFRNEQTLATETQEQRFTQCTMSSS